MKLNSLLFVSLASVTGFAQTPPAGVPDAGQLLRQNQSTSQPAPSLPAKAEPIPAAPIETETSAQTAVRFMVGGFEFSGNTVVSSEALQTLLKSYVGREVSLADLNMAAREITNLYRQGGYFLAQAYVPPQQTRSGGKVKIAVIEGVLESVSVVTSPETTRVPRRLIDAKVGDVQTGVPALEAPLTDLTMRLGELPSITSRVLMERGDAQGTAKAKVQITEGAPYRIWVEGDNYGSQSTGFYRVGGRISLYSPFRLGDTLEVGAKTSTTGDTQIGNLTYAVPLGVTGIRSITDYSFVRYTLGKDFSSLDAKGYAHNLLSRFEYPIIRSRTLSLSVQGGVEGKRLKDDINSFNLSNERQILDGQFGANLVATDQLLGGGSSSINIIGTVGNVDIKNATALANDTPPAGYGTDGGYKKVLISASRNQAVYRKLTLYLCASTQWSDGNLDSSEQFLLGGPYGVRAYPMQEAMCDLGFTSTMELRHPIEGLFAIPGRLQVGLFVDHAEGRLRKDPLQTSALLGNDNTRSLTGTGLSITWFTSDSFMLRASVAWRCTGRPESKGSSDNPSIYIQVIKSL
jgi:hemolysin activation/secretion protein